MSPFKLLYFLLIRKIFVPLQMHLSSRLGCTGVLSHSAFLFGKLKDALYVNQVMLYTTLPRVNILRRNFFKTRGSPGGARAHVNCTVL